MSYTTSVKNELATVFIERRCCMLSEIAGLLNTAGDADFEALNFKTENWAAARKCFTLIKKTFNIEVESGLLKKEKNTKSTLYEVKVNSAENIRKIAVATGIGDSRAISGVVVKGDCCKRSYLRGAFLAGGSVASPEKEYHLEIALKTSKNSEQVINLLAFFEIGAKAIARGQGFSVYVKDSSKIADFLNVCGAKNALFAYENARALKEVRNGVNRLVNCDTANITKTVNAAQKQLIAIEAIEREKGLDFLSDSLKKMALARKENPELKLQELGALLGIGKSGANHRLRKIEEIAADLNS